MFEEMFQGRSLRFKHSLSSGNQLLMFGCLRCFSENTRVDVESAPWPAVSPTSTVILMVFPHQTAMIHCSECVLGLHQLAP